VVKVPKLTNSRNKNMTEQIDIEQININLKKTSTWRRIFFMLVLMLIFGTISPLLWVVIFLQIITTLITGGSNLHIHSFSRSLCTYLYHIALYLTFNTESLPFPFASWQMTEQFDLANNSTELQD
jgi:Domain of unknown function (DUF4389)